jgi:YHS domain-containing protein
VDPVTGEAVDKATAVLAQDAEGAIHYLASAQNLRAYRPAR